MRKQAEFELWTESLQLFFTAIPCQFHVDNQVQHCECLPRDATEEYALHISPSPRQQAFHFVFNSCFSNSTVFVTRVVHHAGRRKTFVTLVHIVYKDIDSMLLKSPLQIMWLKVFYGIFQLLLLCMLCRVSFSSVMHYVVRQSVTLWEIVIPLCHFF